MSMPASDSSSQVMESVNSLVSGDVRRHNLSLVASYLVSNGPSSRSQIADGTGLTRGAVTALTRLLTDAGVVRTSGSVMVDGGKGRPLTLLELAADNIALLALQLDADQATALVVSLAGQTLFRVSEQHGRPMGDPDAVLDVLARVLGRALSATAGLGRRILDLTVVVFAPVGGDPGQVIADTDLAWGTVDVLAGLRQRVPAMPDIARLRSDAPVAALAEYSRLSGVRDLLYVKSNSGIGGAMIIDGRLVEGAHGLAGAFGHVPVDHDGAQCACGQRGCLVTVAGPDVVLAAAGLGSDLEKYGLTRALAELSRRVADGEQLATTAWDNASLWLARTLHILSMSFDPQTIMLGGYWAGLAEPVRKAFGQNRPVIAGAGPWVGPGVIPGILGDDAALLGAVWAARDRLLKDPLQIR